MEAAGKLGRWRRAAAAGTRAQLVRTHFQEYGAHRVPLGGPLRGSGAKREVSTCPGCPMGCFQQLQLQ